MTSLRFQVEQGLFYNYCECSRIMCYGDGNIDTLLIRMLSMFTPKDRPVQEESALIAKNGKLFSIRILAASGNSLAKSLPEERVSEQPCTLVRPWS
jgi:hypothetical protein